MFIYTNNNHDIKKLEGCEFPLVMVLENGTTTSTTKKPTTSKKTIM